MTHSEDGRTDVADVRNELKDTGYLKLLQARFPHMQSVSLRLLLQHATFRELCEEYEACAEALKRLTHTPADDSMRNEYTALSLRLEGELLRYIGEHDTRHER